MMEQPITTRLDELARDLKGFELKVKDDPDSPGFFSVFACMQGTEVELAGKIGEKAVAVAVAELLSGFLEMTRRARDASNGAAVFMALATMTSEEP